MQRNIRAPSGTPGSRRALESSPSTRASDWYVAGLANLHEIHLTPDWLDLEPAIRFEQFQVGGNAGLAAVTNAARVKSIAGLVNGATLNNLTLGMNYYLMTLPNGCAMLWAKQMQALIMHNLKAFLFRTVGMNLPLWAVTPAARVHDHLAACRT